MVKIKSPFTYVFTLDDYHNQCVYFFRALLNNTSNKDDYFLLRNFYLVNDNYYTKLLDVLTDMFKSEDEYLILAFSHIVKFNGPDVHDDKKKAQYDVLRIDLFEKLFIQKPEKIEGFKMVHQVNFYL